MRISDEVEVVRFSDVKYENITSEITYLGQPIMQINQDKGLENLEVEIYTDIKIDGFKVKMSLELLDEAINVARQRLQNE